MVYWHEIVESYDAPKSDGSRSIDHGTFSQKISVILLIYLTLGTDYPTGIAKYFTDLLGKEPFGKIIPRVLTNPSKISSVIKRMTEDKLLIRLKQAKVRAGPRSYYVINPQILQSPIRESTAYIKRDGSPLIIPLESIDNFLGGIALEQSGTIDKGRQKQFDELLRQERHNQADELFEELFVSGAFDYFTFMFFIEAEARKWDSQRKSGNQRPALNKLISDYIHEFRQTPSPSGLFTESFLSDIRRKPSIEAIELRRKLQKFIRDNRGTST